MNALSLVSPAPHIRPKTLVMPRYFMQRSVENIDDIFSQKIKSLDLTGRIIHALGVDSFYLPNLSMKDALTRVAGSDAEDAKVTLDGGQQLYGQLCYRTQHCYRMWSVTEHRMLDNCLALEKKCRALMYQIHVEEVSYFGMKRKKQYASVQRGPLHKNQYFKISEFPSPFPPEVHEPIRHPLFGNAFNGVSHAHMHHYFSKFDEKAWSPEIFLYYRNLFPLPVVRTLRRKTLVLMRNWDDLEDGTLHSMNSEVYALLLDNVEWLDRLYKELNLGLRLIDDIQQSLSHRSVRLARRLRKLRKKNKDCLEKMERNPELLDTIVPECFRVMIE